MTEETARIDELIERLEFVAKKSLKHTGTITSMCVLDTLGELQKLLASDELFETMRAQRMEQAGWYKPIDEGGWVHGLMEHDVAICGDINCKPVWVMKQATDERL